MSPRFAGLAIVVMLGLQLLVSFAVLAITEGLGWPTKWDPENPPKGQLRLGLAASLVYDVGLVFVAAAFYRTHPMSLVRELPLRRPKLSDVWVPLLSVVAAYGFVGLYSLGTELLPWDSVRPESTVPDEITGDALTLGLAAVLVCGVAPLAEEVWFRGVIFRSLLPWGPPVAMATSGLVFSAVHLDLGSLLPFTLVGALIAWLYWRRGNLADAAVFHYAFNATSLVLLVARGG